MGSTAVGVQRTGEVIVGRRWGVETCAMHSCTAGTCHSQWHDEAAQRLIQCRGGIGEWVALRWVCSAQVS